MVFTSRTKHEDKRLPLVAEPRYAQALVDSGIDVVNTVNNHCFDFRVEGYQDTIETLDALGFAHFGSTHVNNSRYEQDVLFTTQVKGVKIGALGFTYPQDKDLRHIKARIDALREAGCDLVIVSLHWGQETHTRQNAWQMQFARKVIRAGADVIWGHHAHVLQPVQFYRGKPIFYSTGNFTFGSMSGDVDRDTGIFQLVYDTQDKCLTEFRVIPCRTTGQGDYRPYVLSEPADRTRVFGKLIDPIAAGKETQNLPQRFAQTGRVTIRDGVLVE